MAPNLWRLSERGRYGSVVLGGHLARYEPRAVVSSEERKAEETAEIVAERLGIGRSVHPGLHEHDRTGAPFLSAEEFDQAARAFFERPGELVWGNETAEQALVRFDGAVRAVLDMREEEVVVVVAHGTVISLFVARYNDVEAYELWRSLDVPSYCILSETGFCLQKTVPTLKTRSESLRRRRPEA